MCCGYSLFERPPQLPAMPTYIGWGSLTTLSVEQAVRNTCCVGIQQHPGGENQTSGLFCINRRSSSLVHVQALLMQPLLWLTGEKGTLVVSQAASLVKWAGSAAAQTKFQVIGFETCGAFAFLALPTISAIKANAVRAHEQGAVQGAISGMQALASGIGPLIFMQLFRLFTKVVYVLRVRTRVLAPRASHESIN